MMFPNLEAELARKNYNYKEIAKAIGKSERTAINKLSGITPFNLDECFAIKDNLLFDVDIDISTLFERKESPM